MSIDNLLSRLPSAKRTSKDTWRCACPAHQGTNKTALSIKNDNGKILINCFHGCSVLDVLGAVGLDMTDLFEDDVRSDYKTTASVKPHEVKFYPRDLLSMIDFELKIVMLGLFQLDKGITLTQEDRDRMKLSYERIKQIQEMNL
jgi:hypothetical protein